MPDRTEPLDRDDIANAAAAAILGRRDLLARAGALSLTALAGLPAGLLALPADDKEVKPGVDAPGPNPPKDVNRPIPARRQELTRAMFTPETRRVIARGLDYLAKRQAPRGNIGSAQYSEN